VWPILGRRVVRSKWNWIVVMPSGSLCTTVASLVVTFCFLSKKCSWVFGFRPGLVMVIQMFFSFSWSRNISALPPVFFFANSLAGITRELFKMRVSLELKNSGRLLTLLCWIVFFFLFSTMSREWSRGRIGFWAISCSGRLKSKLESFIVGDFEKVFFMKENSGRWRLGFPIPEPKDFDVQEVLV